MVSGGGSRGRYGGGGHRGHHGGRPGHVVGQAGVDESLLEKYRSTGTMALMSKPEGRDEEKRNVHRVREYWLEHEAVTHLGKLLALKVPLATFEATFLQANAHNPKYARGTLRETMRSFFREQTDEDGVRFLTLKLSERPVCTKPSKNILKRWNLGNGMLFFFYAAVGRESPPSGDEILEPFYYQKRVAFVHAACGKKEEEAAAAVAAEPPAAVVVVKKEEEQEKGSTAFFAEQLSLHSGARGRKRRREEPPSSPVRSPRLLAAKEQQQPPQPALPLTELYLPALTPEGKPVTAPLVVVETPAATFVKAEPGVDVVVDAAPAVEREVEIEEDGEAVAGLVAYLQTQLWGPVDPSAVAAAVRSGLWRRVVPTTSAAVNKAGAGAAGGLEGCEGMDAETLGGYLPLPTTDTPAGVAAPKEEEQEQAPAPEELQQWAPDLGQLEAWSFENGALPAFVRACRVNWPKVAPVWRAWNEDLGNNALEWGELWRAGQGGAPEAAMDAAEKRAAAASQAQQEQEEEEGMGGMEENPFAAGAGTSMGVGGGVPSSSSNKAAALFPFATPAAAAAGVDGGGENAVVASSYPSSVSGAGGLTQNKAVQPAPESVFMVDLSQSEAAADADALFLAEQRSLAAAEEEGEDGGLPAGVSAGAGSGGESVVSAATASAMAEAAAYWDVGRGGEEVLDLEGVGGEGPLGLTDQELQLLFASAGLEAPPAGMGREAEGAMVYEDPTVVTGPLAPPPLVQSQSSLGASAVMMAGVSASPSVAPLY